MLRRFRTGHGCGPRIMRVMAPTSTWNCSYTSRTHKVKWKQGATGSQVPIRPFSSGGGKRGETIYALSSGVGRAAISVIRVTGADTSSVLESMLPLDYIQEPEHNSRRKRKIEPRKAHLRQLKTSDGEVIDSALVLWFPGPNSFTGEDMAELHVHGSRAVTNAVFKQLGSFSNGARPAEAGEFSRRAFMNDKMDLTSVEGLADLINSDTEHQRKLAIRQMGGDLAQLYDGWRRELLQALAHIEAFLDFGDDEEDIGEEVYNGVGEKIQSLIRKLEYHCDDNHKGEILREGINVGICGEPNVGKSSLLNLLAKRQAAIVTEAPGTTRDVIEVSIEMDGYPVKVFDTAGIRDTSDKVEAIGVDLARDKLENCQLRIVVLNAEELCQHDSKMKEMEKYFDEDSIIVINKVDLISSSTKLADIERELQRYSPIAICHTCCSTASPSIQSFMSEISQAIQTRYNASGSLNESPLITRSRHRRHLTDCLLHLRQSINLVNEPDLAAEELRLAARALGKITGVVDIEEILDTIFADFCIGK